MLSNIVVDIYINAAIEIDRLKIETKSESNFFKIYKGINDNGKLIKFER
jgi:hypothetical protein